MGECSIAQYLDNIDLRLFAKSLGGRSCISTKYFLNIVNEFVTSGIFFNVTSIQSICN